METVQVISHGKKVVGLSQLTKASEIEFDNTGTDLVSNKVEGAIKEVNAKVPKIYSGTETNLTVEANKFADFRIYYGHTFSEVPVVVANIYGAFTPYSEVTGVAIRLATTTYFDARVRSTYSGNLKIGINWIAMGE